MPFVIHLTNVMDKSKKKKINADKLEIDSDIDQSRSVQSALSISDLDTMSGNKTRKRKRIEKKPSASPRITRDMHSTQKPFVTLLEIIFNKYKSGDAVVKALGLVKNVFKCA